MDERTRRTDDEATPDRPRTVPAPIIKSRPGGRRRIVIGLIVLVGIAVAAYLLSR
jgi:hypothetical protein